MLQLAANFALLARIAHGKICGREYPRIKLFLARQVGAHGGNVQSGMNPGGVD